MSTTQYVPNISVGAVQLNNVYASTDLVAQGGSLSPVVSIPPGTSAFQGGTSLITTAPTSNTAVYLPGPTGNYLNFGGSSPGNFDTTTSNLFVEAWFYSIGPGGGGDGRIQQMAAVSGPTVTTTEVWGLIYQNSALNLVQFFMYPTSGSATVASLSVTLNYGNWYYLAGAWNYQTKTCYAFCNGVASTGATMAGTPRAYSSSSYSFMIGADFNTGNTANGYIHDLRVTKGGIVPTTNFTPETAPFSVVNPPSYVQQGLNVFTLLNQFNYTTNSSIIQQWIQKTINTIAAVPGVSPYWSNTATYNAVSITWPSGSNKSYGCVLIPDGRVIFPPGDGGTYIGIFNPSTNIFSSISAASGYAGGVLAPDGRVVFVPENATNVGVFNPVTGTFTTYASGAAGMTGSSSYWGGALASDGRVIFCPNNAQNVGTFNPATNSFTTYACTGTAGVTIPGGSNAYWGGVLVLDGRIVFVPGNATNVGVFNPVTNSFTTYASGGPPGSGAHYGGVLAPDGRVIFTPSATPNVGTFNPSSGTYTSYPTSSVLASPGYNLIGACLLPNGNVLFASRSSVAIYIFNTKTNIISSTNMIGTSNSTNACLLPDGRIVFSPQNDTTLAIISGGPSVPSEFCLHPFFNKY